MREKIVDKSLQVPDEVWTNFKNMMGYSDEELEKFKKQPATLKFIKRRGDFAKYTAVYEVVESKGCMMGQKVGDKYYAPGGISLDLKQGSEKICPYLLPPITRMSWNVLERVLEGLDPLPLFDHGQCDDVGVLCGGWGRVVIKVSMIKNKERHGNK
ncbi:hypothetical protein ACFL2O_00205 [Thermodesulfobacteriota bacterium]